MPVIFILLILYLRKGNYMYDCNFISLFFTPVTKTDNSYIRVLINLFIY